MPSFFSIRFCFVVFFFVFCLDYLALQALTCSVKTSRFETILPNLYFDKMNLDFSKFFLDFRKLKLCFANTQTSIQNFVPILVIRGSFSTNLTYRHVFFWLDNGQLTTYNGFYKREKKRFV